MGGGRKAEWGSARVFMVVRAVARGRLVCVAEGFDRVHEGGAAGGVAAGEEADDDGNAKGDERRPERDDEREV